MCVCVHACCSRMFSDAGANTRANHYVACTTLSSARRSDVTKYSGIGVSLQKWNGLGPVHDGLAVVQKPYQDRFKLYYYIQWWKLQHNCTAKHPNTKGTPQPYTSVQMLVQYNAIQTKFAQSRHTESTGSADKMLTISG